MDRLRRISQRFKSNKSSAVPQPEVITLPVTVEEEAPDKRPLVKRTKSLYTLREPKSRRDLKAPVLHHVRTRIPSTTKGHPILNPFIPPVPMLNRSNTTGATVNEGFSRKPSFLLDDEVASFRTKTTQRVLIGVNTRPVRTTVSALEIRTTPNTGAINQAASSLFLARKMPKKKRDLETLVQGVESGG